MSLSNSLPTSRFLSRMKLRPMTTRLIPVLGSLLIGGMLGLGAPKALANEGVAPMMFHADATNVQSAQRGARDFMNYCSGCHSMKYLRYSRMGTDLGISEDLLKKNLMFTSTKPGDTIESAMPALAKEWFGQQPPDLTLETKARGADWVYSYLMSFYLDDKRPLGVNNLYLPGVSMPHVLGELQGWQVKEAAPHAEAGKEPAEGHGHEAGLKLEHPGKLTTEEYRDFITDLVNFMTYAAEPSTADRLHTGGRVMVYLLILLALTYYLKKEFWRDIH
jgi:ubiquinol-cytochrome c reductase cytochrome c1 subunit